MTRKWFWRCAAVCVLFALIGGAADAQKAIPEDADFWSDYPDEQLADFLVSRMSDEELLSQMLMFGWKDDSASLLNRWISERGLGNVKVFGWNTDNLAYVAQGIADLQRLSQNRRYKIPLFVATDQEGGWIRHVKGDTAVTPGNLAIGAGGYPIDAYYSGYYINREIKALGINMNFAPTVDIYTNHRSTVIGPRSFGEQAEYVGALGVAFVAGSIAAGVIPTAKHFPGHGDTDADSHGKSIEINLDAKTLNDRELLPFKYLISEKIPAIMSAHLKFPRIEPNGPPVSLSKKFLTDILRNQLHYEGLIITDDMQMNGATSYAKISDACTLAIEAGNDIILSSDTAAWNEQLWEKNLALVRSDTAFRQTVRNAARRVILHKLAYFKGGNAAPLFPDPATIGQYIPDREGQRFFLAQACRSVTVYKKGTIPYRPQPDERVLLAGHQEHPEFFAEAEKRLGKCARFPYKADMGPYHAQWVNDNLVPLAQNYDTIIICVDSENNATAIRNLQPLQRLGKRVIILSIQSPVPAMDLTWADSVIFGYSYSPYSFQAMFAVLAGDFEAKGSLPLK
ncbi:MAG: glycoside hydrolase family 3 protein [Treponemataceae bacterium]|nr:glycoside hydrolase family 3 protein [Treponemataceae bacterium]